MKRKLLANHPFRTKHEAEAAVFDFIEALCNPHRSNSVLDYLSPISFEQRAQEAA